MNLEWVRKLLENKWFNVYYVALYGSQNYWLETDTSDFDYKAIIVPSLEDLVNNTSTVSTSYEFEWWLVDVKDIRVYIDSVVKCNINFLEVLNTKHFIGNWELRQFFKSLQEELWVLYLKSCYGMMLEKEKALRHKYPSTEAKIEKFWYDPKQLHHIVRLKIIMERYMNWNIWDFHHEWSEKEYLLSIKKWAIDNSEVDEIVQACIKYASDIRNSYNKEMSFESKGKIIALGKEIVKYNIRNQIISELLTVKPDGYLTPFKKFKNI